MRQQRRPGRVWQAFWKCDIEGDYDTGGAKRQGSHGAVKAAPLRPSPRGVVRTRACCSTRAWVKSSEQSMRLDARGAAAGGGRAERQSLAGRAAPETRSHAAEPARTHVAGLEGACARGQGTLPAASLPQRPRLQNCAAAWTRRRSAAQTEAGVRSFGAHGPLGHRRRVGTVAGRAHRPMPAEDARVAWSWQRDRVITAHRPGAATPGTRQSKASASGAPLGSTLQACTST